MKVKALDRLEVPFMWIKEIDRDPIREQPGLRVDSDVNSKAHGLDSCFYVMSISRGAVVDLPVRLAKEQLKIGHVQVVGDKHGI